MPFSVDDLAACAKLFGVGRFERYLNKFYMAKGFVVAVNYIQHERWIRAIGASAFLVFVLTHVDDVGRGVLFVCYEEDEDEDVWKMGAVCFVLSFEEDEYGLLFTVL